MLASPNVVLTAARHLPYDGASVQRTAVHPIGGQDMRSRIKGATFVGSILFLAACSAQDGKVWMEHNTHFASGEHAFF